MLDDNENKRILISWEKKTSLLNGINMIVSDIDREIKEEDLKEYKRIFEDSFKGFVLNIKIILALFSDINLKFKTNNYNIEDNEKIREKIYLLHKVINEEYSCYKYCDSKLIDENEVKKNNIDDINNTYKELINFIDNTFYQIRDYKL